MSSPSDYPRAYICDECIDVCVHIIEMERTPSPPQGGNAQETPHSLLAHPQISILLDAVERWIRQESLGDSGAEELAELRSTASRMLSVEGKN